MSNNLQPKHYLTLPRTIVYQLAGLIGIATGGLASYALKSYKNQSDFALTYGASIDNMDISAAAGIVITSGALAGTAVGLMIFAIMLRPGHPESVKSVRIKEVVFSVLTALSLVAALVMSIITASKAAKLTTTGLSQTAKAAVRAAAGNLRYKSQKINIALSVLSFVSFLLLLFSTYLISKAARHVLKNGPAENVKPALPERLAGPYLDKWLGTSDGATKLDSGDSSLHNM